MNPEKFAELINGRWPDGSRSSERRLADVYRDILNIRWGDKQFAVNPSWDDWANSLFIIWCLDRLEELGMRPSVYRICSNSADYLVVIPEMLVTSCFPGKTRAEACARALYAALGGEE